MADTTQKSIVKTTSESGDLRIEDIPLEMLFEWFPIEKLDHLVHHLRNKNRLSKLTPDQVNSIRHDLGAAGFSAMSLPLYQHTHIESVFMTNANSDALEEPRFKEAYELGGQTKSWSSYDIRWRVYVCC